jgi:hypothetical protein
MQLAQGWLAIGFWTASILVFIFIKLILWDILNENVKKNKAESLLNYNIVYIGLKELKSFSISQIEELEELL